MTDPIDDQPEESPLAEQFIAQVVASWRKATRELPEGGGNSQDDLAPAMLSAAINMLLTETDARNVAELLFALAAQINPQAVGGHA